MIARCFAVVLVLAAAGCSSEKARKDEAKTSPEPAATVDAAAKTPALNRQYFDDQIEKLRQLAAGKKDTVLFDAVTKLEVLVAEAVAGKLRGALLLKRFDAAISAYIGRRPAGGDTMSDLSATGMSLVRIKPARKLGDALARVRIDAVDAALVALAERAGKKAMSASVKKLLGGRFQVVVKQYEDLNKRRMTRAKKHTERLRKLADRTLARLKVVKEPVEREKLERVMKRQDHSLVKASRVFKRAFQSPARLRVNAFYASMTELAHTLLAAGSSDKLIAARFGALREAWAEVAADLRHVLTFRKAGAILNLMRPRLSR